MKLKKIGSLAVALTMICTQLPVAALAADSSLFLVKYGTESVSCATTDEVNTALANAGDAENIEVELQDNVTATATWTISKSCTLDLNGKTYTGTTGNLLGTAIQISDGAAVTVMGDGIITNDDILGIAVGVGSATDATSALIVEGGTISATNATLPKAIYNYGSTTINGGSIEAAEVLSFGENSSLKITGGELKKGAEVKSGSFEMTGGTIRNASASNGSTVILSTEKAVSITGGTIEETNEGTALRASQNTTIGGNAVIKSTGVAAIGVATQTNVVVKDNAVISGSSYAIKQITNGTAKQVTIESGTIQCGTNVLPFSPSSIFVAFPEGKTLSATPGTNGYTVVDKTGETDTTTLSGLVDASKAIYATNNKNGEENIYKQTSWDSFSSAYKLATTVLALDEPLQAEADIVATQLKTAKDGLKALNADKSGIRFGADGYSLTPGLYKVPVYLQKAGNTGVASAAAACIEKYAMLTVEESGTAKLTVPLEYVEKLGKLDWAHDWQYKNADGEFVDVDSYTTIDAPEGTSLYKDTVVNAITLTVPDNRADGVTVQMEVDAMGYNETTGESTYAVAWLAVDYEHAVAANSTTAQVLTGSAKVDQFGKYTVNAKVTTEMGMITSVEISGSDWGGSEDGIATNQAKLQKAYACTKTKLTSMSATDAEAIGKVDTVSGATTSCTAVKDAVINALGLKKVEEVINVPTEKLQAGTYTVDIAYITDQVAHGLTGVTKDEKTQATIIVDKKGNVTLDTPIVNGTSKENLYVYSYNGYYQDNDRTGKLITEGTTATKSDTDYSDDYFKDTQVITNITMPLIGNDEGKAYAKQYWSNISLYVPAMCNLNGETSGVVFDHGKFSIDAYVKVYWDTARLVKADTSLEDGQYTINATMVKENQTSTSMANSALVSPVILTVKDGTYSINATFNGIEVLGQKGYMASIGYYPGSDMTGTPTKAEVLSYQTNDDGSYVVDQYNNSSNPYPKTVTIPVTGGEGMEYIPLQVNVPAMGSGETGNANTYMQLDWSSVKEYVAPADTTALTKAISDAKAISNDDGTYTADSYKALTDAIAAAEQTAANESATQAEIDAAAKAVTDAQSALVKAEQPKPTTKSVTEIFTDVKAGEWYVDYIQYVYDNGLMSGTNDGTTFSPDVTLTRAMVAQILYARADKPSVDQTQIFTDVKKGDWYFDAVQWAKQNNVVAGYDDGTFGPNDPVTREQLAQILYAAQGKPNVSCDLSSYADAGSVDSWALNGVKWAVSNGLITGVSNDGAMYLQPTTGAIRSVAATIFMQYDSKF